MASARATATRWRMPPESSCGRLSASRSPTVASISCATARRSSLPTPLRARPNVTFCRTVSQGKSEASWKISERSGDGAVIGSP